MPNRLYPFCSTIRPWLPADDTASVRVISSPEPAATSPTDALTDIARDQQANHPGATASAERYASRRRRKFMPHVTVARFPRPPPATEMQRHLDAHSPFRTATADVGAFHPFSSVLRSSGARYTIEATWPLADAPPAGRDPASRNRPESAVTGAAGG